MAPNKDLARLKELMKKKIHSSRPSPAQGTETSATPSIDLENVRVPTPLSRVPPAPGPVVDLPASQAVKRKKGRIEGSQTEDPKAAKKAKSSRSSKHKAGPVPVDATFFEKNLEEYKVDPFGASANLFKHVAEVKKLEMAEFQRKTKEELIKVEAKLAHANNLLMSKGEQLEKAKNDLDSMTASRDDFKTQAESAQGKVSTLEGKITELETSKVKLEEEVAGLREQVRKLEENAGKSRAEGEEDMLTPAEARIVELEKQLEEMEKEKNEAVDLAVSVAEAGFQNAIDQIELVHPDLHIDHNLIRQDCEVEDGKIVYGDPNTGEKFVIFPEQ